MNTVEELVREGISEANAEKMLKGYAERIGTENGDYEITDITYIGDSTKRVEETCRFCGTRIYRELRNRRNKWCELQRECECQKQERMVLARAKAERLREEKHRQSIEGRVGQTYGEHKIVGIDGSNYVAQCMTCGAVKMWSIQGMPHRTDYVCHTHRQTKERFTESYIGMKNNYLTVIGITWDKITGRKRFRCQCDCGNMTEVKPTFWEDGQVISCGCYLANRSIDAAPEERIKGIWRGMRTRCLNKNCKSYPRYGGRGIKICPEW